MGVGVARRVGDIVSASSSLGEFRLVSMLNLIRTLRPLSAQRPIGSWVAVLVGVGVEVEVEEEGCLVMKSSLGA